MDEWMYQITVEELNDPLTTWHKVWNSLEAEKTAKRPASGISAGCLLVLAGACKTE